MLILIPVALTAQEHKQNQQSVELPEFVITGVERISLPAVSKPKAELISTLSNEFFKPQYSPEELQITELSNPIRKDITFVNNVKKYNGRLTLGAGIYTMPMGELVYGNNFDSGLLTGRLWGLNQMSYEGDNSGYNTSGIELKSSFFKSHSSGFLPGTKLTLGGDYLREAYRFFKSVQPDIQRDIYKGNINFGLDNLSIENFKFGAFINERFFEAKDIAFTENTFNAKGFIETGFNGYTFGFKTNYINQNIQNPVSLYFGFWENSIYIKLKPFDDIQAGGGIYLAGTGSDKTPLFFGNVIIKINDKLSFLVEMNPCSEFTTIADLIHINRYLNKDSVQKNIFTDNKLNIKAALKYEYETYFEIDGGFRVAEFNNFIYFTENTVQEGRFDVKTTSAKRFSGFVNLLFHPGPYGIFYGNLEIQNIKDKDGWIIPYNSNIHSSLSYELNFKSGLNILSSFEFYSSAYTDLTNTHKLNAYADLRLRPGYEAMKNLNIFTEFSNILNQENCKWGSYKEKRRDVVIGIDYKF